MRLLIAALLFAPLAATAQQLPRQLTVDGETLYAYDTPCDVPAIMARVKPAYRDKVKAAKYVSPKAALAACYADLPESEALLFLFDDGSAIALPEKLFAREMPMVRGQRTI